MPRDEFTQKTVEEIAKAAGYLCSNPDCVRATIGSNAAHDYHINVGVAAHITAAAPGGPRHDALLTSTDRKHRRNGIWLCQDCAKLVDSDLTYYTVEHLKNWKLVSEERAFQEVVDPKRAGERRAEGANLAGEGIASAPLVGATTAAVTSAALADLAGFRRANWPHHAVALNLRMLGDSGASFTIVDLPAGIAIAPEVTIVAPPGTGKTTTLLQLAETLLKSGQTVALFIPLGEWATHNAALLSSVLQRRLNRPGIVGGCFV